MYGMIYKNPLDLKFDYSGARLWFFNNTSEELMTEFKKRMAVHNKDLLELQFKAILLPTMRRIHEFKHSDVISEVDIPQEVNQIIGSSYKKDRLVEQINDLIIELENLSSKAENVALINEITEKVSSMDKKLSIKEKLITKKKKLNVERL